jgi:hypothetical protein
MIGCASGTPGRRRLRHDRLLLASGLALVLSALPVGMSSDGPPLSWQAAFAKGGNGGGGGNGNGGGNGGGHGRGGGRGDHGQEVSSRGGPDHGRGGAGHGNGHDRAAAEAKGYHDLDELVDSVRNGKAIGLERQDERIAKARDRYQEALGQTRRGRHGATAEGEVEGEGEVDGSGTRLSPEETKALMARGWKGRSTPSDGYRNHGERVRTMVELAKRLGYGARVGAMQGNFGTPDENGISTLQAELAEAEAKAEATGVEAEVERLEAALQEAIAAAKPGNGPDDSWATADLDVNDDGFVDQRDLEALAAADEAEETDQAEETDEADNAEVADGDESAG